ncbi:MAG: hypothetical protein JW894_08070 [Bacteroidales bacterium]|nr:hypothetical protein [Bacteroidales bacterium]
MSIINEIFESGFDFYKFLTARINESKGLKQLLIREIQYNLTRLKHRNSKGIDKKALIENLKNDILIKVITGNYKFHKLLSNKEINPEMVKNIPRAKKYTSWDCNKLMNSIDQKIVALKDLPKLFPDFNSAPINLTSRLDNLYLQLLLVTLLIKKSEK